MSIVNRPIRMNRRDIRILITGLVAGLLAPWAYSHLKELAHTLYIQSPAYGYRIFLNADNVGLLKKFDPVLDNGASIGVVENITLNESHQLVVRCRIQRQFKIQNTSIGVICMNGFDGAGYVNLRSQPIRIEDKVSPKFFHEDDTISVRYRPGIADWLYGDSLNFFQKVDQMHARIVR